MGVISPVATKKSRINGKPNNFRVTFTTALGATLIVPISSTVTYHFRFTKCALSIKGNGIADQGTPYPFTANIQLRRRGK